MTVIVIGGGPAGLMAAEVLAERGIDVAIHDAMPSPGRKFLLAGKGGLNLTHSEALGGFIPRYGARAGLFQSLLADFGPADLRRWAKELGIDTFVGSSGRVFPDEMKSAPLLRAWIKRLKSQGVTFNVRHYWLGWAPDGGLRFRSPQGEVTVRADATVLALGGASWPHLGSDGCWETLLAERGIDIAPMKPANCGFDLDWSRHFADKFAGRRLSTVVLSFDEQSLRGEVTLTATGMEGGCIYALSAPIRDAIAANGLAMASLDLMPDWDEARVLAALSGPRGSKSLSTFLKKTLALDPAAMGLLRELLPREDLDNPTMLAASIKALPLPLLRPRPLPEAISTAGGVRFEELDSQLMLKTMPGVFAAGEMLDWEAPTGGYLLTGSFATGRRAGLGAAKWVTQS
ncbi:aminoacetone oxidase family FAD-binding enzyme [Paramagnetospirillum kuznetsovii]|uniref:Aminoacetone oxidase family FAD-binding enzyme n=1 Tax=Paramagnetospirillum kuznetsovii TaxID=2053833 RepID=A0A364NUA7_9PROT|nr:TIGR03862 family flavoprotein [Paramagnetospirillum kuznetsovii]RAU20654.1 aminoacetone oxidase family FAD-binding enzyme [Paramagnetospirillum kuznetsovii]